MGLMTGLGLDLESSWDGLLRGQCPAKRLTLFDPQGLASDFGVQLPDGADELFAKSIMTRNRRQMTRTTMMNIVVADMALADAGLVLDKTDRSRVGVVVGATGTGYAPRDPAAVDEHRILRNMASAPAAWISLRHKLSGPSWVVSTACASGAYALHSACMLVLSGQCDVVVAGSADSTLNYLDMNGFCSLLALSESRHDPAHASRPFDKDRNGFVMGEGGGFMLVESPEHARMRGARVYARMAMPGITSEAFNILSPEPSGTGMARSMLVALVNAGIQPRDIDYINAHGTSTPQNDAAEVGAIKQVFGERATRIPVSSTKSMTGHCLSAAAGVEAVICCKALVEGAIPPTANLTAPDLGFDLDFVPAKPRTAPLRHVMSNSFAFGGHNGVCVFSAPEA